LYSRNCPLVNRNNIAMVVSFECGMIRALAGSGGFPYQREDENDTD